MTRRTNQGGSIATFIVIGVILVSGLIGSIYLLNKRGEQVREDQTIAANEKKQSKDKPKNTNDSTKTGTTNNNDNQSSANVPEVVGSSQKLPASGNELSVSKLFAIYFLVMVATAFVLSFRKQKHSL